MHRFSGALALICLRGARRDGLRRRRRQRATPAAAPDVTDTSGKRGGHLDVLSIDDITSLDPGYWYYAYDYQALHHPTQRSLYGWKPNDTKPSPDLAAALPTTSADGKTVTIKIKPNIKYSPPLQDRAVKSADVKYALERSFLPSVQNQYSAVYYSEIDGVERPTRPARPTRSPASRRPTTRRSCMKLTQARRRDLQRPVAVAAGHACRCPRTTPQKYDKAEISTYGKHQVFTGPYMIKNDGKGNITGYKAGRRIDLVRNPSWEPRVRLPPGVPRHDLVPRRQRHRRRQPPDPQRQGARQRRLRGAAGQRPALGAGDAQATRSRSSPARASASSR